MSREKDIQELCRQVLKETYPNYNDSDGFISCPFCSEDSYDNEMSDIEHEPNCAYLIAKDLSTK